MAVSCSTRASQQLGTNCSGLCFVGKTPWLPVLAAWDLDQTAFDSNVYPRNTFALKGSLSVCLSSRVGC